MKMDVYCDEAYPDLLTSKNPQAQYMIIGSIWLKTENRENYKQSIHKLRDKYKVGGEFKWQKVSPSRVDFFRALVDWFWEQGDDLRFRCIAVDRTEVNLMKYHYNDQELGFYKFYYQLLHHWIFDFNNYNIFCDYKSNRKNDRFSILERCLSNANLSSHIDRVQAVRSDESVLIQLVDVLIGLASERLNTRLSASTKGVVLKHLESFIGHKITPTGQNEKKFNVFKINLQGGW